MKALEFNQMENVQGGEFVSARCGAGWVALGFALGVGLFTPIGWGMLAGESAMLLAGITTNGIVAVLSDC